MRPRTVRVALWTAALLGLAACNGSIAPLEQPLAPGQFVANGARLVVAPGDLQQLADTVHWLAGHQVDVAVPPQPIAGTLLTRSAFVATIKLGSAKADWTDTGSLVVQIGIGKVGISVIAAESGAPGCAVAWKAKSGLMKAEVSLTKDQDGPKAVLVAPPSVAFDQGGLSAVDACAAALPKEAWNLIDAQVTEALRAGLAQRVGAAATQVLRTALPPTAEVSGQIAVGGHYAAAKTLRVDSRFSALQPKVVSRELGFGEAILDVGIAVDLDACAVDVAPPSAAASAKLQPAEAPPSKAVLRRAIALDGALLQRMAWAWVRSGDWCRESGHPLEGLSTAAWPAKLVAQLAPWVDGAPTRARLWPHASPAVGVTDSPSGPLLTWTLQDATLELVASLGGADAVVLAIRGQLHGQFKPIVTQGGRLALAAVSASSVAAVVSSPLFGEQGIAAVASGSGLDELVSAAVRGIFEPAKVLPLEAMLPLGSVVTGVSRGGDGLWIWIDGGVSPP